MEGGPKEVAPVLILTLPRLVGLPFPQRPGLRTIVFNLWFP